jgi:hypothetical protein
METAPLKVPGFGLPINHTLEWGKCFPNAIMGWPGTALTLRELTMLQLMNSITEKPEWDRKVFDANLIQKWGQEATDTEGMDVTDRMLDYVSCREQSRSTFDLLWRWS